METTLSCIYQHGTLANMGHLYKLQYQQSRIYKLVIQSDDT